MNHYEHYVIMFIIMFFSGLLSTMNVWVDKYDDIRFSINDIYMTLLHRPKRKMRQKFIKNINKTVSFHYSDVKAPRRALNYLTISTFYRRNG